MKNKLNRILLLSFVFAMGKPIFAGAKPLPDFNAGSMNWGTQRYKFDQQIDGALAIFSHQIAKKDPQSALQWAQAIEDPKRKERTTGYVKKQIEKTQSEKK